MTSIHPPETSVSPKAPKIWRAGTLTYTVGGLALLFCWLLWGDFAWSIRDRSVYPIVQLLFKRFGASDTFVGFFFSTLPGGIGMILGPIIGYRSDRLRSRWGRRLPFLIIPTPFIVLSIVGLAFSPQIGEWVSRFLDPSAIRLDFMILGCIGFFWTVFEISCITANAVFGALINDVVPQAVIGRFFGLFRAFSLIAGVILNFWILGKAETHYTVICLGVGLLYGAGFILMCLKVKEGDYPPPPHPPARAGGIVSGVRAYFKDSFANPYYRWFFATGILCSLCSTPFNIYSLFFAKSIGMDLDYYFKCIALSYGISLCLAYPLGVLVDRYHPLRVSLIAIALYGIAMVWGIIFVKNSPSFAVILVAHTVLSGSFFTTSASLGQRLLPQAKFAELSSAGGVLGNLAGMSMALALGFVLDCSHHAYHIIFHVGLGLSIAGIAVGLVLHRKFLALGGPKYYQAPEE